jgi:hypothetical protein
MDDGDHGEWILTSHKPLPHNLDEEAWNEQLAG